MKVDVKELWNNTYTKGRPQSHLNSINALGKAHKKTAELFNKGIFPHYKKTPSYKMFMSDSYGKFYGMNGAEKFLEGYIAKFAENFKSIKEHGYDPKKSKISVDMIDGKPYLIDGNRRLASIMAIGKEHRIEVMKGEPRFEKSYIHQYLERISKQSPFLVNGKHILYQPTPGFENNNDPTRTAKFEDLRDRIIREIGDPKKKHILDIGSCFGFFSFAIAKLGAFVTGIETDGSRVNASRMISGYRKLDWSNPKFIHGHAAKYIKESKLNFDTILMISVFHCLYREDPKMAWKTLNNLAKKSNKIILCMDHNGIIESQKNVKDFILDNSILNKVKFLGKVYSSRYLYSFTK